MNLDELIDKCGDRFASLYRSKHFPEDRLWYASYHSRKGYSESEKKPWYDPFRLPYVKPNYICGTTKREAVQELLEELTRLNLL